jgi:hypothetical protein
LDERLIRIGLPNDGRLSVGLRGRVDHPDMPWLVATVHHLIKRALNLKASINDVTAVVSNSPPDSRGLIPAPNQRPILGALGTVLS